MHSPSPPEGYSAEISGFSPPENSQKRVEFSRSSSPQRSFLVREVAEGWGFEPMIRRQFFAPSSGYLLRNDWLSSSIGALLYRLGWPEAPQGIAPCRVVLLGGAEVVRRMAPREPQRIP